MLQNEHVNREIIARAFVGTFNLAQATLNVGTNMVDEFCREKKSTLPTPVKSACLAMLAREVRRYRAIVAMLEIGLLENATVLTRSLYEGLLSERFILRDPPTNCSKPLLGRLRGLKFPTGDRGKEFRVQLYAAYPVINYERLADQVEKLPGNANFFGAAERAKREELVQKITAKIGQEWVDEMKNVKSYSGLQVVQLAEWCDLVDVHGKVYGPMSMATHATEVHEFIEFTPSGDGQIKMATDVSKLSDHHELAFSIFVELLNDIDTSFALNMRNRLNELLTMYRNHSKHDQPQMITIA